MNRFNRLYDESSYDESGGTSYAEIDNSYDYNYVFGDSGVGDNGANGGSVPNTGSNFWTVLGNLGGGFLGGLLSSKVTGANNYKPPVQKKFPWGTVIIVVVIIGGIVTLVWYAVKKKKKA